jgi:hypothetical protein
MKRIARRVRWPRSAVSLSVWPHPPQKKKKKEEEEEEKMTREKNPAALFLR